MCNLKSVPILTAEITTISGNWVYVILYANMTACMDFFTLRNKGRFFFLNI